MNKLFKLGRITDKTTGGGPGGWSEIDTESCTTTYSADNSGHRC